MTKPLNLLGERFNRLLVVARAPNDKAGNTMWECLCDCGNTIIASAQNLKHLRTQSCGCLHKEIMEKSAGPDNWNYKHGQSSYKKKASRTYKSWECMIRRCYNPKDKDYSNWGGRGITICGRWRYSFENFLADMGERPLGTTIDRVDPDGNYELKNCEWADPKQQAKNRRPYKALANFSDAEIRDEFFKRKLDVGPVETSPTQSLCVSA